MNPQKTKAERDYEMLESTKNKNGGNTARTADLPDSFIKAASAKLLKNNEIEGELYIKHDVKRGLRNANGTGVLVGLTKVGDVIGYDLNEKNEKVAIEGKLLYRGYDVTDLVSNCIKENRFGFEETTYLLLFGELPTKEQLDEFTTLLGTKRELPVGFTRDMIMSVPSPSIMNKLAQSVLAMYSYDPDPDSIAVPNVLRQSIELIGYFPALIAYAYQSKKLYFDNRSMHLRHPIPELSSAENILRMVRSNGEFSDFEAKLLDMSLILHTEHGGGNNSSFTTHVLSSSDTDTYSVIAAAIGSLKGPKHGGANISVIRMMDDLKENVKDLSNLKDVEQYFIKVLRGEAHDRSGLIYGLGHAIYTISDPRAVILKGMAKKLAEDKGILEEFMVYDFLEKHAPDLYREVKGVNTPLPANVDLYSGFVYSALNIPNEIATPLFAMARLSGWCAHRIEEIVAGKKLIRPAYKGVQPEREYVTISDRNK